MDEVLDDLAAIQQGLAMNFPPVRYWEACSLRGLDRARRVNTRSQFAEYLPIRLAPGRCDYMPTFFWNI
jgi:hypothetical protein